MNLFVFRLFTRGLVSSLRTHSCSVVPHSLKMPRSTDFQKRFESSTPVDSSKLSNSLPTDDFDFDEDSSVLQVDVDAITNGDPDKLRSFKILQLEVEVRKLKDLNMPSSLSIQDWKVLMMLPSRIQREKFLRSLWLKELRETVLKTEKRQKREAYMEFKASKPSEKEVLTTTSPIKYNMNNVFLFQLIRDSKMHRFYHYKLLQAEWFGPHIILDCGYDSFMSPKNLRTCAKEMLRAWLTNRENPNPFDILFCNFHQKGPLWSKFLQGYPALNQPDCAVHHTDEHYLKFFPKEKLVYLTPHCREVLEEFNPDDVYIIGAYVDFGCSEQLSLAKAKKEGLRKAKLPLDRYLKWKQGVKSLSLFTVLAIMNELKDCQSWPTALKHVPQYCAEHDLDYDKFHEPEKLNYRTAASIREEYRKNLVYDLLLNKK